MINQKHLQVDWEGTSVLHFIEPDKAALSRIRTLLMGMPINSMQHPSNVAYLREQKIRADVDTILIHITNLLKDDYVANLSEGNLNVDYHVLRSNNKKNALRFNTRIFYPGHGANVFYGHLVVRKGIDDYILWADETMPLAA